MARAFYGGLIKWKVRESERVLGLIDTVKAPKKLWQSCKLELRRVKENFITPNESPFDTNYKIIADSDVNFSLSLTDAGECILGGKSCDS